jgi:hypothetical protein
MVCLNGSIAISCSYLTTCPCRHPTEKVTQVQHDESTSNLVRHADNCDQNGSSSSQMMSAFVNGSTYNPGKLRLTIATWITHWHRPFTIVEDSEFIEILHSLNSQVVIPSWVMVSCNMQEMFQISQQNVATMLQVWLYLSSKKYGSNSFCRRTPAN